MIARYVSLLRRTPIRKRRAKPRRGEPTAEEKARIRAEAYGRAGGQCELHVHLKCIQGVLPYEGSVLERAHLVHLRARRRFGWSMNNVAIGCFHCHIEALHTQGVQIPKTYEELEARTV